MKPKINAIYLVTIEKYSSPKEKWISWLKEIDKTKWWKGISFKIEPKAYDAFSSKYNQPCWLCSLDFIKHIKELKRDATEKDWNRIKLAYLVI